MPFLYFTLIFLNKMNKTFIFIFTHFKSTANNEIYEYLNIKCKNILKIMQKLYTFFFTGIYTNVRKKNIL